MLPFLLIAVAARVGGWPTCATTHRGRNMSSTRPTASGLWKLDSCENAHTVDLQLAQHLSSIFASQSLLELGSGCGCYAARFERARPQSGPSEMMLLDGTENIATLTGGRVLARDLTLPLLLDRTFDWVLSLEVGEHIPRKYEQRFIHNLVTYAARGIILSWAIPGQGGTGHVNTRSNAYIKMTLARMGWALNDEASIAARANATFPWFTKSLMVYFKK
mmetsp:Transcript_26356/g.43781  ORF Transcript_26356/g.43781 Transcript_26356/m.43781 type:complete len:219 (-) Transcript_26356:18-674(-)